MGTALVSPLMMLSTKATVFLGGSPGQPVVDYQYHPTRSGTIPSEVLRDYNGFIQTDGYEGYQELGSRPGGGARGMLGTRTEEVLRSQGGLPDQGQRRRGPGQHRCPVQD